MIVAVTIISLLTILCIAAIYLLVRGQVHLINKTDEIIDEQIDNSVHVLAALKSIKEELNNLKK